MNRTWSGSAPGASHRTVRAVHASGLAAVLAGLGFWGAKLYAPEPPATPRVQAASAAPTDPAAQLVSAWLGPGQLHLDVAVVGLMRRHDRAVAVLKVNGASPKAFMAGETLARDVTLVGIEADAVTFRRAGVTTRIAAPARPDHGALGIVRVR